MSHQDEVQALTRLMANFTAVIGKRLPDDVVAKLQALRDQEQKDLSKVVYDSMFENLAQAIALDRPACQDTGVINYFVKAGTKFPYLARLQDILVQAVKTATMEAPLRHNAVEIFEEINTGDNTGERAPFIHWEIINDGDEVEIEGVEWMELGMPESLWICRVKEFGPLIVSIDTAGNNLFENNKQVFRESKDRIVAEISHEVGFIK